MTHLLIFPFLVLAVANLLFYLYIIFLEVDHKLSYFCKMAYS